MALVGKGYISPYSNKVDLSTLTNDQKKTMKKFGINLDTLPTITTRQELQNVFDEATKKSNKFINTDAFNIKYDQNAPKQEQARQILKGSINNADRFGATAADFGLDVLQGGIGTFEGMADTGTYLLADIADWGFGNKNTVANAMNPGQENWANKLANNLRSKADFDFTGALMGKSQNPEDNFFGNWQKGIEEKSILGDTLDQINQSIGQIGSYALTGNVLGNTAGRNAMVTFTSSYGNAKSQAKRNGASEEDAIKTALISATAETISENLFDAIPQFKTGGWGNKLTDNLLGGLEKFFGKKSGKLATKVMNAFGEGTEEILSNFLNMSFTYLYDRLEKASGNEKGFEYGMATQNLSGNYGEDLLKMISSPETWEEFFSAAFATALTGGGRDIITNAKYNNAINTYAKQNNVSVEQAKADFEKVLNYAVKDNKTTDMSRNEVYELEDSLKRQLSNDVKRGLNLSDAALNVDRTMMEKQANLPIIRNTFEESLVNHGFDPNNEVWKSISRTLEKRGITGIVDEQYFNDNSENALIINDGNGNRIMAFNPNADTNTIIQENTVHELVHDLIASENSKRKLLGIKAGQEIKDSDIIKYFEKLDGYKEARADLEKVYSNIKDKNGNLIYDSSSENFSKMIDEEVVAKVLEKNLGTQETINRLVHENRNLAQRIYDWIMNKIKNRGGVIRDEELYWRNIQNRFVKAFNMEYENSNEASTRLNKVGNEFEKNSDLWYNQNDPDYIGLIAARPEIEDYSKYSMLKKWLDKPTPELDRISKMLSEDAINKKNQELTESKYNDVDGKTIYDYNITNDEYKFSVKNIYEYESGDESRYEREKRTNSTPIISNESQRQGFESDSSIMLQNTTKSTRDNELSREQYEEWFNRKTNNRRSNKNQGQKELTPPFNNGKENLPLDTKYSKESKEFDNFISKDNEQINVTQNGELKTYNNYYDFAKSITKNNDNDLAKELLFKYYDIKFELPTNENETSLYHGTDRVTNYDDFKVMDFDDQTMDRNYGDYFYIINDKSGAKTYGNMIAQFVLPNNKIMSLEEYRNSNKSDSEIFKDYWAIEMPDGEYIVNDPKQIIDYSKQKAQEYIKEREKTNLPLAEQLERQGTKILEEAENKRLGMIEHFKEWIEEENITNPTQDDIDNSLVDLLGYDNEQTAADNAKDVKLYNQYVREYMKENGIPFIEQKNATQDNQGRTLTKQQQDYFKDSKVRDDGGQLLELYHGTPNNNFTIFDESKINSGANLKGLSQKGFYFTDNYVKAEEYSAIQGINENNGVKKVYLNITNPLIVDTTTEAGKKEIRDMFGMKGNKKVTPYYIDNYINEKLYNDAYNLKTQEQRNEYFKNTGYDGVISKSEYGNEYIVFNSNQIKNINNTNPTKNEDIRYSKKSKAFDEFLEKNLKDTGTTGDLMAIHNLNEEKLKGMLELGGTAYPSIAITTPSTISHEGYGDISVLFDKSTIDPANKLNKVYSRDAYTPRFPTIEYKLDSNVKRQIRETIGDYDYRNAKPGDEYISDAYGIIDNIEDNINRSGLDRALEDVKNNDAMKYVYLKNTNPDFKVETKNETYSQKYNNETLQRFIDNYDGEYELNDIPSSEVEKYVSKMVDAYKQQLETEKGNENDLSQKLIDVRLDKLRNEFYEKNNFLMAAYKLQKYGTEKQVLDKQATKEKMNSMINQEEYNQWVDKLFENIIEKKGLRNNKDYYTSSGNPRSFEQLHDEYTLNNVVKIMSELNDTGEEGGFFYGISEIAGNASQRFNTIEDIKANKNLLTTVGDEEYHQILDNMQERLSEIEENVMERGQNNSDNYFIARDNMASVIADAARIFGEGKKIDANKIQKMLKEYGFEVTTEESQKILDMFSEMRNLPTQYFEAKPQRAVGLDEVQAVVIPNTASEELRKQLNDAGFDFVEYDPTIEGDRQRVINKFDNLKFDKNSPEWDEFVNKHIESTGTKTKLGDTKLPMAETNLPMSEEFVSYLDNRFQELQKQIDEVKPKKETNLPTYEKTTMPLIKQDDVLKISNDISNEINKTGDFNLRKWTETSTESDILKGEVFIEDLDPGKITYEVQSNKKSLEEANRRLETYGYDRTLNYVKELLQSDKLPSASDVALMQRMIQEAAKRGDFETVQNLIIDTAIVGTDLGQATQALSIIQKLTPEGQLKLYTKLVQRAKARGEKSFKNVEITPQMVQNILEAYKPDGTYDQNDLNARVETFKQDIAKQMKTTKMEKLDAWRYLAMLGNPKTHIRNMISNVAMKETLKVKNAVARTLETILPVKERTKTWKQATPEIKNYAKQTAVEMKDIIQGKNKYNEKVSLEAEKQIFNTKFMESIRKFNNNALEFEDWLFSKSAFIKSFQEYLTANGIRTKEDVRNNPEIVQKAKNYAVEQSEIATFRQYSKMASLISKAERTNPAAKFIIGATLPFKKTPINVAKTGVKYSPLGLIKSMTYDTYRLIKGDINASQYIDNISQGLTGSTLTLLGYGLAKAGVLSGSGDDDKEGKYDSQLGNTGYSVNIGDKSYSISWLSPVAMPLLVGANAYEQLEEEKEWDMNVVSETLAKTLDPLNEMSFLQGLTNALQSYGSGTDKIKGSLESIAQNYIGQFFPTLFSQIASTTDDKKRSTKASNNSSYKFGEQTLRSIMYKLPIARQQLEVATDIWGNEKEQSDNIFERAFESFIAPYSKTQKISTELDNELKEVYNQTGETKVLPSVPYGYITYKNETYRMSASEFTEFKKDYGQTANKMLNNLVNTQAYKDASYEDKADMIDEMYEYAREKSKEKYFKDKDTKYESKKLDSYKKIEYVTSYDKYVGYKAEIDKIKEKYKSTDDMTSKQKTAMNNKRKTEVQKYINTLPLNRQQKLMLQKFAGNYSVKDNKKELQNYINSLSISKADKEALDKELFG